MPWVPCWGSWDFCASEGFLPAQALQREFRGVEGWRQEEGALLLSFCPKMLIICPMHCPLLILNSRYKILMA